MISYFISFQEGQEFFLNEGKSTHPTQPKISSIPEFIILAAISDWLNQLNKFRSLEIKLTTTTNRVGCNFVMLSVHMSQT
jgi:hypothetical protein